MYIYIIYIIYTRLKNVDIESTKIIYKTLFYPHIEYCCGLWCDTYHSNIQYVYNLQNKALKFVLRENTRFPCFFMFGGFSLLIRYYIIISYILIFNLLLCVTT